MSETENPFKVGDMVKPSPEAYVRNLRPTKIDFPWRVHTVKGDLVVVERPTKSGKTRTESYHHTFLQKV